MMDPSEKTTKLMAALNKCDVEFDLLETVGLGRLEEPDCPAARMRCAVKALREVVEVLVSDLAYERSSSQGGWLRFPGLATQLEARKARRARDGGGS